MPLTFLAHQAPFLPLARRWPRRVDGLALVLGTMAPDFSYVLVDTPLQVWAHGLPGLVTFCLPVTWGVAWLVARGLARVVAAHLPDLGAFHLRDYRGLAAHDFRPLRFTLWAMLGAFSHAALDSVGHSWGWPVQHWSALRTVLFPGSVLGEPWTLYRVIQYGGHLVLTPLAVALLLRYGRQRWFATRAARVRPFPASTASHARLWSLAALGFLAATAWVLHAPVDSSAVVLRLAGGGFFGLVLGAAWARRLEPRGQPAAEGCGA